MAHLCEYDRTNKLAVSLFGKFSVQFDDHAFAHLDSCKVQELFCYLLLHRDRAHPRENLASLLWSEVSTAQSKSYLRKTLWQLQTALDAPANVATEAILCVDPHWVQLNSSADLWLDAAIFEHSFTLCQGLDGPTLETQQVQMLQEAVSLYNGDLLQGWFQEWCLYERERFQQMVLIMLDKLITYCEAHGEYESGISYGKRILQYDPAHERTHRQLMRLYYLVGDRTEAIRQYERCVALLSKELNVGPARKTLALYEQLRTRERAGISIDNALRYVALLS
ncbi:MAG: BTAD domain-containing putative transcriptional regulator [Chloroflexi bacterium]|nr:BTAD domain-containing putative transcriptional regulator [Chloroflexota bacterium]